MQANSLCTRLPQDRVAKFNFLKLQQPLKETHLEDAAGYLPTPTAWHDTLIELGKNLKNIQARYRALGARIPLCDRVEPPVHRCSRCVLWRNAPPHVPPAVRGLPNAGKAVRQYPGDDLAEGKDRCV